MLRKKRESLSPTVRLVLPMELRIGDRFTNETGEWEVVSQPYTSIAGKVVHARVQTVGEPAVTANLAWRAHERVAVMSDADLRSQQILRRPRRRLIRLLPRAAIERVAYRELDRLYRLKISAAKAASDQDAVNDLYGRWAAESRKIGQDERLRDRDQRLREQRSLFRKARRLYVQVPLLTEENSVNGVLTDVRLLDDLVVRLRRAQKERQELMLAWIQAVASLLGVLTGLVGAAVALYAVMPRG